MRPLLVRYARARPRPQDMAGAERRVVILLGSAWGMGGTIRAAHNLAGHLAQRNEVEILSAYRRRDEPFMGAFPPGVTVTALDDQRPGARPRWRERLVSLVRARGSVLVPVADVGYEGFSLWSDIQLVRRLRRGTGVLIATRPGLNLLVARIDPPGFRTIGQEQMHLRAHNRRLRRAMQRDYGRLDALAVLTRQDLEEYRALLGARAPRLAAIPNTVRAIAGERADPEARTALAAGRLTPQKGFDLLIPAWAQVAAARPDWKLAICGRGERREQLAALVDQHGLQEHVALEPAAQDLAQRMRAASIYVLSSRFEGFPLVLLEAMAAGMAVVAFDCPTGPGEVIDDHRNGLLVPCKDVDALAAAILEMIEDGELRRRCADAAVETAHDYTMEAIGPRWDALLDELRGGQSRSSGAIVRPASLSSSQ
jgi:glycosyltransferase involved in cell wall biosynthesis